MLHPKSGMFIILVHINLFSKSLQILKISIQLTGYSPFFLFPLSTCQPSIPSIPSIPFSSYPSPSFGLPLPHSLAYLPQSAIATSHSHYSTITSSLFACHSYSANSQQGLTFYCLLSWLPFLVCQAVLGRTVKPTTNSYSLPSTGPLQWFSNFWSSSCWVTLTLPTATVLSLSYILSKP
jgi:hypothetical protein